MEEDERTPSDFGVIAYLSSRLSHYWLRYVMMAIVMVTCISIFIIVMSLIYGLDTIISQSPGDLTTVSTPALGRFVISISDREALALSGWLIISTVLIFMASMGAVFNTAKSSTRYSNRDIGILKSIGISERQITKIFVLEALWISIFSWFLGMLLAVLVSNQFIYQFYMEGKGTMFFAPAKTLPEMLIFSFALMVIMAVLGSYFPARKASKCDPVEALAT